MAEPRSFLLDLEDAVSRGTPESCLQALWHATDVLIAGQYSEEQIWTFGEVIERLAEDIEITARVRLANKLATSNNAPTNLMARLLEGLRSDLVLIPCKSAGLSPATVELILRNRPVKHRIAEETLKIALRDYGKLSAETAERTVRFWQLHDKIEK